MSCISLILNNNEQYKLPKLIYLSKISFDETSVSNMHCHEFVELIYISRGTGIIKTTDSEITVKKGSMIIINPEKAHTELCKNNNFEYYILGIGNLF